MKKRFLTIAIATSIAAMLAGTPMGVQAQSTNKTAKSTEKKAASEKSETAPKKSSSIPFQGHLLEVNKSAKTIKVDKRTFEITSETKIHRGDKSATLEDGVKGEYITGSYKKGEDGKLIANSVYFGGKNKEKGTAKETSKPATEKK